MNKTVDINLAGIFFHIDEKAYALLKKYLDALRATFATTEGKDEILADIEARVAELLHERKANKDQVIETEDIEAVIVILGQPEDYVISEDPEPQAATQKKLFRDPDDSYVGGVAAGLAHYFGLDTGWLRIVWAILIFFSGGSFLVIYILFWILIPEAKTTTEKLQMKGEPVNVGTSEKKIREEFNSLADKVKNVDYEQAGSTLKKKSKSFSNNLATLILSLIKIAGKLVGIVLIIFASLSLFGITLGFVTTNVVGWVSEFPLNDMMNFPILKSTPIWLLLI
ncbi:MAG: PspC domain-containing protein, partial [Flavobacteriaceae bacterium]